MNESTEIFLYFLLFLIFLGLWIVIYKNNRGWIAKYLNPDYYNFTTPEKFPITNPQKYQKDVNSGFIKASKSRVVFTSLVRDIEKRFSLMKENVNAVSSLFSDWRLIVLENDSKDNSRRLLKQWSEENPKVILLGCGVNEEKSCHIPFAKNKTEGHAISRNRIEKMALLRDYLMNVSVKSFPEFDLLVVWDLDIDGRIYVDGIAHSIEMLERDKHLVRHLDRSLDRRLDGSLDRRLDRSLDRRLDGVCAYGFFPFPKINMYYDAYAHVLPGEDFNQTGKTGYDGLLHSINVKWKMMNLPRGGDLQDCDSCFGGFTIYKMKSLKNLLDRKIPFYEIPSEKLECEHLTLNKKLKVKVNPSMIFATLAND